MKRGLLYCITPLRGAIPDHVLHCLSALRPHFEEILITINGSVENVASKTAIAQHADQIFENAIAASIEDAYRAGLDCFGWDKVATFDELAIMNCDLFGPIFPVSEFFETMDQRIDLDVWGLAEATPISSTETPTYLVSSFTVFRKKIIQSADFRMYWSDKIRSKSPEFENQISIDQAEFLKRRGYLSSAFLRRNEATTPQPLFLEMQESIRRKRLPFLAFTPFCRSPAYQDERPSNLNQVLRLLEKISDYPQHLFWQTALHRASLRTLHTNMAYQFTFDSDAYGCDPKWDSNLRIAVCAHVYYPDVLDEILDRAENIPVAYDLYITTASAQNKVVIEDRCAKMGLTADVRVVGQNRGRDMSSLYIDLKDVVIDKDYDLICRLHSKKSPQVNSSTGVYFKHFIFDAVLATREYTSHLLDFLVTHPHVGMAFAPMIHTGYATMGNAWFDNRGIFARILSDLGCEVEPEPYSAIAAYGTVYWFRPDALRPLFQDNYTYDQYNEEPNHIDGGLAHGQERAMTYIAQARGYMTATVWPDYVAAQSTTLMEYKMDSLYSLLPARYIAPHWNLMMFMQSKRLESLLERQKRSLKTPEFMKKFEKRNRAAIKRIGKKLGLARARRVGN